MKFSDIVGNRNIKERLINALKINRIHHAFLFTGPSGIGKISMALSFAQYVNCTNRTEEDSCGVCKSCQKFSSLQHPDLHFIFPVIKTTKNNKPISLDYIEQWRDYILKNTYENFDEWLECLSVENQQASIFTNESQEIIRIVNLKPFESQYKTIIIYLPERMNINAANKLLKSIEEPPPNTLFFLITEDDANVLGTIKSRTQIVKFIPPSEAEISNFLKQKYNEIDLKTIEEIARISDGDVRLAIKQINKLNLHNTETNLLDLFKEFVRVSYTLNFKQMIEFSEEINLLGRERQKTFIEYCIRVFNENFLLNNNQYDIKLTKEEVDFSKNFSKFVTKNNIENIYKELSNAHYDISRNASSKLVFLDLMLKISQLLKQNK